MNDNGRLKPGVDDLAIDLAEAGHWLRTEFKFRPRYELPSLVRTSVELLGDRHKQYGLSHDYINGIEGTLAALVLVEHKRTSIAGLCFVRDHTVSRYWSRPDETATLCARSVIVSVLRHFTGSAVESTSGMRQILIAEIGMGLDGVLGEIDLNGNADYFEKFFLAWSKDISDHRRFLNESPGGIT